MKSESLKNRKLKVELPTSIALVRLVVYLYSVSFLRQR